MYIKITENEGINYSRISGDKNKIHTDNITGYNSHYGTKICHGTLLIIKFLDKINLKSLIKDNSLNINIKLKKFFLYNHKIQIKKKPLKAYQKDGGEAEFTINFNTKTDFSIKKPNKTYIKRMQKFRNNNHVLNISILLNAISKYVGMIYPGKLSIISEISINFFKDKKFSKSKLKILSNSKKGLPIIFNSLFFDSYQINFKTFKRPILKIKKVKIKENLKNKIKKIKNNVLILGSGSGIGNELLRLFSYNKK